VVVYGNAIGITMALVVVGYFICVGRRGKSKHGIVNRHILEHMILNNYRYAVTVILLEDSLSLSTVSSY
jgi:hypothetical protein